MMEIRGSNISKEEREKIVQARNSIEEINLKAKSDRLREVVIELTSWIIYSA